MEHEEEKLPSWDYWTSKWTEESQVQTSEGALGNAPGVSKHGAGEPENYGCCYERYCAPQFTS